MKKMIEVMDLTKTFGTYKAVDNITFEVDSGEIFGLVGPNGAGKTTTIRMLTTLLTPTSGRGLIGGYDIIRQAREVRRLIGYVPQMLSVDGSLTGYENLLLFARLYDVPSSECDGRIREVLSFLGLEDAANSLVKTYSGGMIRKLEIGQAMLHSPRVLFLDEPTVGLDPVARRNVWNHIKSLRETYNTTILVTTHYMDEAESMCNRLAIMHLGRISGIGTPEELKRRTGKDNATLEDAFAYFTGAPMETGGTLRDTLRVRRTARRLG
ncbi:MAG TPA: ATP-binding cassette domain-containing protein [Firmicutes bacterium]|nr:ATP-binding cassette domain-containing protein [Bacillota bacterium]